MKKLHYQVAKQSLTALRRAYAEELRVAGPVRKNLRILEAFAKVPREKFLPPGPWTIHGTVSYRTSDADPAWLCHNVLVTINKRKNLNSGSPSMWAYLFDQIDIAPGERVFQIGAGTGYYTAILAELVGSKGFVRAAEYDKRLASAARANLKSMPNVELIQGDGSKIDPGHDVDVIVAFTGGTHPAPLWLERLAPSGRLLMPLVTDDMGGFMMRAIRRGSAFQATALSPVWFFLAEGFRDKREARDLKKIMRALNGKLPKLRALHLGKVPARKRKSAFFATNSFWLSGR